MVKNTCFFDRQGNVRISIFQNPCKFQGRYNSQIVIAKITEQFIVNSLIIKEYRKNKLVVYF